MRFAATQLLRQHKQFREVFLALFPGVRGLSHLEIDHVD